MLKRLSKFLLALSIIFAIISTFSVSFAEVDGEKTKQTTSTEESATTTGTAEHSEEHSEAQQEEIHNGDLYLFDNDIVMDKLVDGNVFIFGTNVKVTGQINGNLFILASNATLEGAYISNSIYVCAPSVNYTDTRCDSNLYVLSNNLDMTYEGIVYRDLKVFSSNAIIKSAIGRDADLLCSNINFGSEKDIAAIYGNLRYSSNKEIEIPAGVIAADGSATYTKPSNLIKSSTSVVDILIGFATCIITTLALYVIFKKATPKLIEKLNNKKFSVISLLKSFGLGLGFMLSIILLFILLLGSFVGVELGILVILLFVILCLIATPCLAISITNILKPILKVEKTSIFYLTLALVSIVLYGLTFIPFIGGILGFIINILAVGLLIDNFIPHKELTDEEKAIIKENKEKAKQEKAEIKKAKKEEKNAKKEVKKADKITKTENKKAKKEEKKQNKDIKKNKEK